MNKSLLVLFVLAASASAANAQILSANASADYDVLQNLTVLVVEGSVSIMNNQSLSHIKIERGTIAAGNFTPFNPANEVILQPGVIQNTAIFKHTYPTPVGPGNYAFRVTARVTVPDPITGIPTPVTVPEQYPTVNVP